MAWLVFYLHKASCDSCCLPGHDPCHSVKVSLSSTLGTWVLPWFLQLPGLCRALSWQERLRLRRV